MTSGNLRALAINGGQPAVTRIEGILEPKIGIEEFAAVADT